MSGKTIRSFNAESEVNDIINESSIKKGELSTWINDKIKKGLLYERNPHKIEAIVTQGRNLRVEL